MAHPVPYYQPGYYPPPSYGWQGGWNQPGAPRPPSANKFPEPGNRAWFTKEHLELIEKWKARESSDGSKNSEKGESSGGSNAKSGKKGRQSTESENSEERLKSWISSTFGTSLKKISEKLDEIEVKSKTKRKTEVSEDNEEGKKELGSNEKRKRGVSSPALSKAKVRSRTRNTGGTVTVRQPRISISSDDEDSKAKIRSNCRIDVKHEQAVNGENKKLDEILTLLGAIAGKGKEEAQKERGGQGGEKREKEKEKEKEKEREEKEREKESESERKDKKGKGKATSDTEARNDTKGSVTGDETEAKMKEGDVIEYMKGRLDYYMAMNVKEVKALCVKRGLKVARKDKCAWEMTKQDAEQYTKLMNREDEDYSEESEDVDQENDESSEQSVDEDSSGIAEN
ncbi:hypothetical protein CBR_g21257 [Chara braunii]|uniref:Uncharacterized protein n=1 Tax=Chara braunii TaxID=69332 RepID=A0A388L144_CHABU|nr:hypothetical protein CBR_g21257 [Chara braunii]|eukprot:GBG76017.1 hypothetical protein CBR_g21257 [Chara braunii]